MRTVTIFFTFILLIIILSPVLAYPIHLLLENFTDYPFYKLVSHTTLICGLIFSGYYLKYQGNYSKQGFGYDVPKRIFIGDLLKGIFAGIVILSCLKLVLILFDIHQVKPSLDYFWSNLPLIIIKAILSGLAVGFIEETIFRGALFSSLYRKIGVAFAVVLTSLVYSAVHFLKYRELPEGAEINWYTGLEMLPDALYKFSNPIFIIDHFLTLLALGVLLAMLRLRNGNIAMCIGVHAGLVMAMKVIGRFTDYTPGSPMGFLVNSSNHLLGYLSFAWILLLVIIYWRKCLFKRV